MSPETVPVVWDRVSVTWNSSRHSFCTIAYIFLFSLSYIIYWIEVNNIYGIFQRFHSHPLYTFFVVLLMWSLLGDMHVKDFTVIVSGYVIHIWIWRQWKGQLKLNSFLFICLPFAFHNYTASGTINLKGHLLLPEFWYKIWKRSYVFYRQMNDSG